MQKKPVKWMIGGIIAIILLVTMLTIIPLAVQFAFPDECNEGMVQDRRAANTRGDIVADYARACGFGVFDESVVLQLAGVETLATLVKYGNLNYAYPKFRWIDEDTLNVDLGNVYRLSSRLDKVGNIRISYSYTMVGPPP
jgi:hypothetical protein